MTADLKNVRGINVIGRTQVFDALKHLSTADLQRVNDQVIDIGRRLGATWVVGGAYQRLGPRIRITAEFVDVRSGRLLKTVKVDGKVDDLFSLQDKIVYELSQGLNVSLRPSEIQAIARAETGSIEAYEAFSRGTMNLRLGTPESMDRAIEQFEQALGIDPHYASAWALLGVTCNLKGQFLTIPELTIRAVELLEHALALDPNHAAAHAGLGGAYLASGRVEDAIRVLKRGTELDPTSALAHGTLARALLDRPGRDRRCDRGARIARWRSIPSRATRSCNCHCCTRCAATTDRPKRRGARRSRCRKSSCPAPKACRSSAATCASATRSIARGNTTTRSRSSSGSWRSSGRTIMRCASG